MDAKDFPLIELNRRQRAEAVAKMVAGVIIAGSIDGSVEPGMLLPSETDLARRWGVSRRTVHLGLEAVERDGLIEMATGNGWKVAWRVAPVDSPAWEDITDRLGQFVWSRLSLPDGSWLAVNPQQPAGWQWLHCGPKARDVHAEGIRDTKTDAQRAARQHLADLVRVGPTDEGGT